MIVARGLGRGTGRVLVTAGLGLVNAASGPPPVLPPLGEAAISAAEPGLL